MEKVFPLPRVMKEGNDEISFLVGTEYVPISITDTLDTGPLVLLPPITQVKDPSPPLELLVLVGVGLDGFGSGFLLFSGKSSNTSSSSPSSILISSSSRSSLLFLFMLSPYFVSIS